MRLNIKKLLCMTMIGVLAIASMVGCGSASSSSGKVSAKGTNIYFSIPDVDDTFRAALSDAINEAAAESGAESESSIISSTPSVGVHCTGASP